MDIRKPTFPEKAVCVPAAPPVDISDLLPIVDHPLSQEMRYRRQLGVNHLVFPGAVHTRFEHALGVLGLTQRLCQLQQITGDDRRHLRAFAFLHDIGHGPFSHQIEPILDGTHNEMGVARIDAMSDAIRACDLEPDRLKAMFQDRDVLARLVTDRNLGTDKLDYLVRDALHIGFSGMPDIEKVQFYTVLDPDLQVPAIEEKFVEDIKRVQKFYSYLHQHGYLNKAALSGQRLIQRAVQEELAASSTDPSRLWLKTDADLLSWLTSGCSELARALVDRLQRRDLHRTAMVIKPAGYGFVERRGDKDITVLEWSKAQIRRFSDHYSSCAELLELENRLAAEIGFEPGDLLFAAMPFFRKLIPRDVRIHSERKGAGFWLFRKDRDHYRSLEGDYLRTFAIRLIVPAERRRKCLRQRNTITEFLEANRILPL